MSQKLITRTVITNHINASVAILKDGELSLVKVSCDAYGNFSDVMARKAVRHHLQHTMPDAQVSTIIVTDSTKEEQVWGITEDDFMAHAVKVERPLSQQKHKDNTEEG